MVTPPFAIESTTAPFNHMDPYHRGPYFTEQTVHTITFKIYTYNGDRRELWVNEANNNGLIRLRKPEHFFFRLTGDHSMSLRLSDYWRQFFDLPLHHGGSPFADSTDNQLPVTTASPASTVPALASQLLQLLFGQSESGSTTSAPASAITHGISTDQLQALAQGLQTLASWRPSDSGASEAAS